MKFTCNRQQLVDSVLNVQRAVSSRSTLVALEGILIKAYDSQIKLCGYNLELGITTCIDATIDIPGEVVLSAKLFGEIVRKLPDDKVKIIVDDKFITNIQSGTSEFSIIGIAPSEYPELPTISSASDITMSSNILKSMIKQTLFAVSDSDAKPIHTGTLFDLTENQIRLVSVDGYRLAMRTERTSNNQDINFVVPGKTLSEVLKLLPDDEEKNIKFSVGRKHIVFEIENYCVISRLLEGDFLDYNAAIPKTFNTEVEVQTRTFMESVERVSLLITDRLKSPLRCIFAENEIKLSCVTSIGKANDEFESAIHGNAVEIGFNNRYLLDALRNTDTDEIKVQLNGPLNPMRIVPKEGDSFLFLVLPVRLKSE